MIKNKFGFKSVIPIIFGAVGIFIVLFFGNLDREEKTNNVSTSDGDIYAYTESLETKIRELCEAVEGVSHVSVVITLEGGFEYEYAKNIEYGRNSYGDERREEYLVIGSGSNEKCVILRQKLPDIAGVGIVCRGGGSDGVREELIMLVSSVLNVGANKIYITSRDR